MCHSCVSRNLGYFVPATVLLCGKRAQGNRNFSYFLDSRLRGNDTLGFWVPACAGMTHWV